MENKTQTTLSALCGKRPPDDPVEQRKEKVKSLVWDNYLIDKTKPGQAKCIHCTNWLSCKDGATTNLTSLLFFFVGVQKFHS